MREREEKKDMLFNIITKGIRYKQVMVGDNCMVLNAVLPNGFVITEQFATDSKEAFDEIIVRSMLENKIKNEIMKYIVFFFKTLDIFEGDFFKLGNLNTDDNIDEDKSKIAAPENIIIDIVDTLNKLVKEEIDKNKNNPEKIFSKESFDMYKDLRKKLVKESGYNVELTDNELNKYMDKENEKRLKKIVDKFFGF